MRKRLRNKAEKDRIATKKLEQAANKARKEATKAERAYKLLLVVNNLLKRGPGRQLRRKQIKLLDRHSRLRKRPKWRPKR
jgi:hypothetical protein